MTDHPLTISSARLSDASDYARTRTTSSTIGRPGAVALMTSTQYRSSDWTTCRPFLKVSRTRPIGLRSSTTDSAAKQRRTQLHGCRVYGTPVPPHRRSSLTRRANCPRAVGRGRCLDLCRDRTIRTTLARCGVVRPRQCRHHHSLYTRWRTTCRAPQRHLQSRSQGRKRRGHRAGRKNGQRLAIVRPRAPW